jgi:hydrogenase maturation protease
MRTIVIGLGNPILSDDSVGLRVVQALKPRLSGRPEVTLVEDYWGGLRLMEQMVGFERAIIIDALCSGQAAPGTVLQLSVGGIPTQRSASAHDANLPTALAFGRQAGASLPTDDNVVLIAIEAADVTTFDEALSPEVESAIPEAMEVVLAELDKEIIPT